MRIDRVYVRSRPFRTPCEALALPAHDADPPDLAPSPTCVQGLKDEKSGYYEVTQQDDRGAQKITTPIAPTMVLATGVGGVGALLRAAAEVGALELVDALLAAGVSCFEADPRATTALHVAALYGHGPVYSRLLSKAMSSHKGLPHFLVRNLDMKRPLDFMFHGHHVHIGRADKPTASDLDWTEGNAGWELPAGAAPTEPEPVGSLSAADVRLLRLTLAAARGDLLPEKYVPALDEYVASKGVDAAETGDPFPYTPTGLSTLMIMCHRAAEDKTPATSPVLVCAGALARRGASLSHCSQRGCTAIGMAAEAGLGDLVQLLISAKATLDTVTDDGMTPMMLACKNGHGDAARVLATAGANADLYDKRPAEEFTALMHASLWGHVSPVQALLQSGAVSKHNIDAAKVSDGFTALSLAAFMGQTDVMRVLLRAGADPMKGTTKGGKDFCTGLTPLHAACKNGQAEAARALLQYGADTNKREVEPPEIGMAPLHYACKNGHADAAAALLQVREQHATPCPPPPHRVAHRTCARSSGALRAACAPTPWHSACTRTPLARSGVSAHFVLPAPTSRAFSSTRLLVTTDQRPCTLHVPTARTCWSRCDSPQHAASLGPPSHFLVPEHVLPVACRRAGPTCHTHRC